MDNNQDLKSGMKKKKRSKPIEIDFDSDNNEPIGSLFKIKKRNKKKVVSFASEENDSVRVNDNSRVMDDNDTLASFRKRLKGPKKNQGSEIVSALNVSVDDGSGSISKDDKGADLQLDQSSDQPMEDSLSAILLKVQSKKSKSRAGLSSKKKKGNRNVDNGLNNGSKSLTENVDSVVESRSGSASALKSVGRNHESDTFCSASAMDDQEDNQKGGDDCFQEEKAKGICDSNIPDGLSVDHSNSIIVCDEDRQQLSSVQVEDVCGASDEKVALNVSVDDGSGSISKDEKGADLQLDQSSDQPMEDSLSAILLKVQSKKSKSRAGLGSKKKKGNRNVDIGLNNGSKSLTENVDSVVESRSGSASALKLVGRNHESDTFCSVSAMDDQEDSKKGGDDCF